MAYTTRSPTSQCPYLLAIDGIDINLQPFILPGVPYSPTQQPESISNYIDGVYCYTTDLVNAQQSLVQQYEFEGADLSTAESKANHQGSNEILSAATMVDVYPSLASSVPDGPYVLAHTQPSFHFQPQPQFEINTCGVTSASATSSNPYTHYGQSDLEVLMSSTSSNTSDFYSPCSGRKSNTRITYGQYTSASSYNPYVHPLDRSGVGLHYCDSFMSSVVFLDARAVIQVVGVLFTPRSQTTLFERLQASKFRFTFVQAAISQLYSIIKPGLHRGLLTLTISSSFQHSIMRRPDSGSYSLHR